MEDRAIATVVHFLLAVALFFLTNWLGKHSAAFGYMSLSVFARADEAPAFNFLFRVLTPVVFMTVCAAVLYATGQDRFVVNIFWVVVYAFAVRIAFNVLIGRALLINWASQALHLAASAGLAWFVYDRLVFNREYLLPDAATLGNELWLAVVAFVYAVLNRVQLPTSGTERRKQRYLERRLSLYTERYGDVVERVVAHEKLRALVYAVMIFEAFNRPKVYRVLEIPLFYLGYAKTLGIMQVTTTRLISERESVELGARELARCHGAAITALNASPDGWVLSPERAARLGDDMARRINDLQVIRETLRGYNGSQLYSSEVSQLYEKIVDARFKSSSHELWEAGGGSVVDGEPPPG